MSSYLKTIFDGQDDNDQDTLKILSIEELAGSAPTVFIIIITINTNITININITITFSTININININIIIIIKLVGTRRITTLGCCN